ncbi:MAG: GNAT family N-acetyltransferase [Dehalococcoidales bacterium]|nr:GNAT family N-acetyltransferase [Dehalococcoidales bacterium]
MSSADLKYEIRCLGEGEYDEWDAFAESSPQGTIFCTSTWMKLYQIPFKIYGCYRGGQLVGGLPVIESEGACISGGPLHAYVQYQGMLFHHSPDTKYTRMLAVQEDITLAILDRLEQEDYTLTDIWNHPSVDDIRPFKRTGYQEAVRYTFVVDLTDLDRLWAQCEESMRRKIKKAREKGITVTRGGSLDEFDELYQLTFDRQELKRPGSKEFTARIYQTFKDKDRAELYLARHPDGVLSASVLALRDTRCAYYLIGASHPERRQDNPSSLALWTLFEDSSSKVRELDLVGANDPFIAQFKAGFGGRLIAYYGARKSRRPINNFEPVNPV